jgi:hypothetical protein
MGETTCSTDVVTLGGFVCNSSSLCSMCPVSKADTCKAQTANYDHSAHVVGVFVAVPEPLLYPDCFVLTHISLNNYNKVSTAFNPCNSLCSFYPVNTADTWKAQTANYDHSIPHSTYIIGMLITVPETLLCQLLVLTHISLNNHNKIRTRHLTHALVSYESMTSLLE